MQDLGDCLELLNDRKVGNMLGFIQNHCAIRYMRFRDFFSSLFSEAAYCEDGF